jgi:IMP dehydrogenase
MRLWRAGATAVKVGIGPGSLCSTRIETGNGVPQLTALIDVAAARDAYRHNRESSFDSMHIIADGGIKSAGDCVKALCFADMVMAGNLFAGTDESPGEEIIHQSGAVYKSYEGSSTHKTNHVEGVKAMVKTKGPVRDVIRKLSEGIRSGCSYQGSISLYELRKEPEFIRVTNAGLHESHPHSVTIK